MRARRVIAAMGVGMRVERISDIMDVTRTSGCLMILALRMRLGRGGERCLGKMRRAIGMRRGDECEAGEKCLAQHAAMGVVHACKGSVGGWKVICRLNERSDTDFDTDLDCKLSVSSMNGEC